MENEVMNYTFTIIEDTKVPLAASIQTVSYTPVILAILVMAVVTGIVAYSVWFISHKSYITNLTGMTNKELNLYYIHPGKLLRMEYEIENSIANKYIA